MSLHRSLAGTSKLTGTRNVLTRSERLERLKEDGRYTEGSDVYGLPKVRTIVAKIGKKKKKKDEEEEA
ncbi:MAG: small basic protein [Planctomycetota bacterium]